MKSTKVFLVVMFLLLPASAFAWGPLTHIYLGNELFSIGSLISAAVLEIIRDTVIIGGGIAGVITAYFILQKTKHTVFLLEADRIAHGATGHNAGQLVSYFGRPLHDIAKDYGNKLAIEAYEDLLKTWGLLEDLTIKAALRTPVTSFTGYAG